MTRLVSVVLALTSLVGLAGCGDHRVTASGYARLTTSDGANTGVNLPGDVRIDVASASVTGTCTVSSLGAGEHGVILDLATSAADEGLRTLTVMGRTAAPGSVQARLGAATFSSDASCTVDVVYADSYGSAVLETTGCNLVGTDGRTATLDMNLELVGCDIR
jgi:hypothetical protein